MIKGLGTDIVEVSRFRKVLEKHPERFIKRLFTAEERSYANQYKDSVVHLTGRFSAKEAIAKALGTGFGKELSFQDISIVHDGKGKPIVQLSSKAKKQFSNPLIEVSISHCKEYASATAIWF